MGQSKLDTQSVLCQSLAAFICLFTFPSLSMGRSLQRDCGCCAASHTSLQGSKAIPVPASQTQTGICGEKILLRLSGKQQKEHLHSLLKAVRSSVLVTAPARSPALSWLLLGLCAPSLSPGAVALQAIHQPASVPEWRGCSRTSDRYRPTLTRNQPLVASSLLLPSRSPAAAP